jgi:hypothetical protein
MQSLSELLRHACGAATGQHHSHWLPLHHNRLVAWVLMTAWWSRSAGDGHPSPDLLSHPSRLSWVRHAGAGLTQNKGTLSQRFAACAHAGRGGACAQELSSPPYPTPPHPRVHLVPVSPACRSSPG